MNQEHNPSHEEKQDFFRGMTWATALSIPLWMSVIGTIKLIF
ncbi:hypothetical protein [Metabacillus sp. SLBN-84]